MRDKIRSAFIDWEIKEFGIGAASFMCEEAFAAGYTAAQQDDQHRDIVIQSAINMLQRVGLSGEEAEKYVRAKT